MLSIWQNWPAGPLPDQSVSKWNRLFPKPRSGFSLLLKHHLIQAYHLGFDWTGWIVLINSEILITTGKGLAGQLTDKWIWLIWLDRLIVKFSLRQERSGRSVHWQMENALKLRLKLQESTHGFGSVFLWIILWAFGKTGAYNWDHGLYETLGPTSIFVVS